MLKIYGSDLCPDCIKCKEDLDMAGVAYEYLSITEHLPSMKEFLKLRDSHAEFDSAREKGAIGIPCIVDDEGNLCLSWEQYI